MTYTREDVFAGGPGLRGYAYQTEILCENCARSLFKDEGPFTEAEFKDSEKVPQPIFFEDHDLAQHCTVCTKYLYGGVRQPQMPNLDDYDIVVLVKNGEVARVLAPRNRPDTKVLIVNADEDVRERLEFKLSPETIEDFQSAFDELVVDVQLLPGVDERDALEEMLGDWEGHDA